MKVRKIYWLIQIKSPIHDRIIEALASRKVFVTQVHTFQDLRDRFNQARASTVLIGDEIGDDILIDQLPKISQLPEFTGVRFLLTIAKPRPRLCQLAVALGFRDILCMDLPPKEWIQRFEFSVGSGEVIWQPPDPQMSMHSICAINIPARITWLDARRLRFESKIGLPIGTTTRLFGKISDELGVGGISIRVTEHSDTNLKFRYSGSYLCEWEVAKSHESKRTLLLDSLKTPMDQAPFKIFLAVQSYDLRSLLLETLKDRSFDLTIALQKAGLVNETRFIDPDVIIVEHKLIDKKSEIYLSKMAENIRPNVPIYIVGASKAEVVRYQKITGRNDQSVIVVPKLPPNFLEYLKRKLIRLMRSDEPEIGYFIPKTHRLSFAELRLPARLINIHPKFLQMAVPFDLGKFGNCRVDAPVYKQTIERRVVGKIINSYPQYDRSLESFPFVLDIAVADLVSSERQIIAQHLVQQFAQQMLGSRIDPATLRPKATETRAPQNPVESPIRLAPAPSVRAIPDIMIREDKTSATKIREKSFVEKHSKELQVTIFVVFLLSILMALIYLFRQPESEQGRAYSESFRKLYEYYNPPDSGR